MMLTAQQIWFQNRRQNDRRRSKPSESSEVESRLVQSSASPSPPAVSDPVAQADSAPTPSPITEKFPSPVPSLGDQSNPALSARTVEVKASQDEKQANTPPSSAEARTQDSTKDSKVLVASSPPSGRKRAHDEMVEGGHSDGLSIGNPPKIKDPIRRSSSMRLAMTADGAVKIKTSDTPTPSPPKARPQAPFDSSKKAKIARSTSMFEDGQTFRDITESKKLTRVNSNFGRSRDARTWEFYCDHGSDDALATHAEAERKGSAVSAINLIRSASSKARASAALSPMPSRSNLRMPKSSRLEKKKISRAQSSLGRLQAVSSKGEGNPRQPVRPCGSTEEEDEVDDREKENWKPGTQLLVHELRRTGPSLNPRPTLGRNIDLSTVGHAEQSPTRAAAELDVVQGLLSLSQGAWQ